jgi:hypothetical protein
MTGPLVASGAIILDEAGGVLVVEPTGKDTREIPAGREGPTSDAAGDLRSEAAAAAPSTAAGGAAEAPR